MSALPIPQPQPDDDEDVHWALSTASALWGRGETQEALKWLRRAAETASDQNKDERALELFKAAADCAAHLEAVPPGVSPAATSSPSAAASASPSPNHRVSHAPSTPPASELASTQRPTLAQQAPQPPTRHHRSAPPPLRRSSLPPAAHQAGQAGGPPQRAEQQQRVASQAAPHVPGPPLHGGQTPPPPIVRANVNVHPPALALQRTQPAGPRSSVEPMAPTLPRGGGKTMISGHGAVRPGAGAKTLASNSGFEEALARAEALVSNNSQAQTPAEPRPSARESVVDRQSGEQLRSPKSGRRGTRSGRRSQPSINPNEGANGPSTQQMPAAQPPAAQPPAQTKRFEDEVTVDHERPTVIVRYDDLDEKTNVISGLKDRAAEAESSTPPSSGRGRRRTVDEDRKKTVVPTSEPPPAGASELSRITSFRVALVSDPSRGTVEVLPLVPNEPAPTGLVTAILVPVDGTSSAQIAELLVRTRKKT